MSETGLYIVTIRIPRNPEHPAALSCKHPDWQEKHCAEMGCPNYINHCPAHSLVSSGGTCSRKKQVGECPVGSGICTDVTGEHHSYLILAIDAEQARQGAERRLPEGAHITRIEAAGVEKS